MANKNRGETEIEIAGDTFVLRPTFEAYSLLEDKLGVGAIKFAADLAKDPNSAKIKDLTAVVWCGIYGASDGRPRITENELGEKIFEHGYIQMIAPVIAWLSGGIMGGKKKLEEEQAEAKETTQLNH